MSQATNTSINKEDNLPSARAFRKCVKEDTNLPRRVEHNNGFVRLRLCIVVFALFSEDYGDGLVKVLGALTPMEACVEV
ncbi:hypothetical protein VCV18_004737 [Metarhizium anisopliae]